MTTWGPQQLEPSTKSTTLSKGKRERGELSLVKSLITVDEYIVLTRLCAWIWTLGLEDLATRYGTSTGFVVGMGSCEISVHQ